MIYSFFPGLAFTIITTPLNSGVTPIFEILGIFRDKSQFDFSEIDHIMFKIIFK